MASVRRAVLPLPHLHTAAVAVALRGGPRFEAPDDGGLTHLMEHMLFRGAGPHRDARALLGAFEQVGGEPDVYTSEDALTILVEVDPARLEEAVALLAAVLTEPRWHDLEAERAVVLEERLERVDESGEPSEAEDLLGALAFRGHPLGRSILGRKRRLLEYGPADLDRWRGRLAVRENAAVVVAGAVDPVRAERALAPLDGLPAGDAFQPSRPPPQREPRFAAYDRGGTQVELRFAFRGPGEAEPGHAALVALADVLDGGPTARLPETVDQGLAYQAHAEVIAFPDVSLLDLGLTVAPRKLPQAVAALLDVARGPSAGVGEEERARGRLRRAHDARAERDDAAGLAEWAVRRLLWDLPIDPAAARAAQDAVTAAELAALAADRIAPAHLTAIAVGAISKRRRSAVRQALLDWG